MESLISLSKKQNEYIRSAHNRWNFKIGAVRSGKSYVDVNAMIPYRLRAVSGQSGLNLILGVSRETIERDVLQPMREMYTDRLVGTINGRNIAKICGEDVYCLGAEKITQVAKIQGMSVKYCYGDEVAKWNPEVFTMLQSRLDKPYSCFDGSCNPESPNHWLKEFLDNEEIDAYIQKYQIWDNPFLPEEFVENLCKEYEGTVYYQRYILGEWALAEGLIYPMYQDALVEELPKNEKGEIIPASEYIVSIDYGTMNAFAALLWSKRGDTWYGEREYYYSGRDTGIQKTDNEYAEDLNKWIADIWEDIKAHPIYTSLAGRTYHKIKTIIDPSAASFIALLKKNEWSKVMPADNAVLDGIRETAVALQTGKIKIMRACKNWIKEAGGYVWDADADEDKPVKIADHSMDATRYFVKTTKVSAIKRYPTR